MCIFHKWDKWKITREFTIHRANNALIGHCVEQRRVCKKCNLP